MEDFGYSKGEKQNDNLLTTKKFFLIAASLFSVACFVYITINAYYFIYKDNNSNVETIKSPEEPIKVTEGEKTVIEQQEAEVNRSVYDDIFGNKKESLKNITPKIRATPEPAIPPKIKEPVKEDLNEKSAADTVVEKSLKARIEASPKAEVKTEKKSVKAKKRAIKVQLAAMTSAKSAEDYWVKLNDSYSKLLSSLDSYIEEVDLGKRGTFYRLQVGTFFNQIEAEEFCNKYVAKAHKTKADCIIVE